MLFGFYEDGDVDKKSQDGESEGKVDVFREQGLNVLQTVYSGAIEALPLSFSLRTRFLDILEATELVYSEDMQKTILDDMKRNFSKAPMYWDWLARLEIAESKGVNPLQLGKAIQVLTSLNVCRLQVMKLIFHCMLYCNASCYMKYFHLTHIAFLGL